jgi:hypothetical protein
MPIKILRCMACIGIDFDGTLAAWAQDSRIDYDDPEYAVLNAGALLGAIVWVKRLRAQGHRKVVITGRSHDHRATVGRWLYELVGERLEVYTRPPTIGLGCERQAAWKAVVLQNLAAVAYVGDNPRIDKIAAQVAQIPFIDAALLRRGLFPVIKTDTDGKLAPLVGLE